MKKETISDTAAKELIKGKLSRYFGVAPSEARKEQLYKAVVMSVRDIMLEKRHDFHLTTKANKAKRVNSLSFSHVFCNASTPAVATSRIRRCLAMASCTGTS